MTMKLEELEPLKKNSLHHALFSPNTKLNITNSEISKLSLNIKKHLNAKKEVAVVVFEIKP
jgi:hypothetical protein